MIIDLLSLDRYSPHKLTQFCALFLCFSGSVSLACASEFYVNPTISAGGEYSDNRFLSVNNPAETSSYEAGFDAAIGGKAEQYNFYLNPAYQGSRYDKYEILNADIVSLKGSGEYRFENSDWSLIASRIEDTTLTTETGLIGLSRVQADRATEDIEPSVSYTINEHVNLGVSGSDERVSYPGANAESNLIGYHFNSFSLSGTYFVSEIGKFSIQPYETKLVSSGIFDTTFVTDAIRVKYDDSASEIADYSLSYGYSKSNLTREIRGFEFYRDTQIGSLFAASCSIHREKANWNFNASRDLTPTASGLLSRTDAYEIGWSHRISEYFVYTLKANEWKYRSVGGLANQEDYDQQRFRIALNWHISKEFTISSSYDYQRQHYLKSKESAAVNTVGLSISYSSENYF